MGRRRIFSDPDIPVVEHTDERPHLFSAQNEDKEWRKKAFALRNSVSDSTGIQMSIKSGDSTTVGVRSSVHTDVAPTPIELSDEVKKILEDQKSHSK